MALSSKIKVPLPEKGIIVRKSGDYQYVYKVMRTYRDKNGHPTNTRRAIGRLDAESGLLIPNDAYWEMYSAANVEFLSSFNSVRSVGAAFLIRGIFNRLGIADALRLAFGESKAELILTAGSYMASNGNIFEHVSDWCEGCTLQEKPLTSPGASALFASITHDERMAFFKRWISLRPYPEYLAYDVTSFSSHAANIKDAEWGYNRDGEDLPQMNLGCCLGQDSGLPVFYVTYPGSIIDKSHLPYMMAYNKELGIESVSFIMDKGFCGTANIQYMHGAKMPFVVGVEMAHKSTRSAIDSVRDSIVSMRRRLKAGVYAQSVHSRFYGVTATMHIYHDPLLAERQRGDLYRRVEAAEEKLCQLEQLTKKEAQRYRNCFDIELMENGTFTYKRNYNKMDGAARNNGFFCLLTDTNLSSADTLDVYRRKDVIEKGFDDIKNHLDMKRMHTHHTATTDGKMFCAFMALIAVSEMTNKLRGFMRDKCMSKDDLIYELEKIKVIIMDDGKRLMNPLTKTQRTIIEACGLSNADLLGYVA